MEGFKQMINVHKNCIKNAAKCFNSVSDCHCSCYMYFVHFVHLRATTYSQLETFLRLWQNTSHYSLSLFKPITCDKLKRDIFSRAVVVRTCRVRLSAGFAERRLRTGRCQTQPHQRETCPTHLVLFLRYVCGAAGLSWCSQSEKVK